MGAVSYTHLDVYKRQPWDIQSIIYTSGTTGPSKGVLSSYLHMFSNAGPESWPMVGEDDRYMCVAPIFHIGGMGPPFVMLARGASGALIDNFSTDEFWAVAKRTGATVVFLLGVMATFLLKAPPAAQDRDHGVKKAFMVPLTGDAPAFTERFGIDISVSYTHLDVYKRQDRNRRFRREDCRCAPGSTGPSASSLSLIHI